MQNENKVKQMSIKNDFTHPITLHFEFYLMLADQTWPLYEQCPVTTRQGERTRLRWWQRWDRIRRQPYRDTQQYQTLEAKHPARPYDCVWSMQLTHRARPAVAIVLQVHLQRLAGNIRVIEPASNVLRFWISHRVSSCISKYHFHNYGVFRKF